MPWGLWGFCSNSRPRPLATVDPVLFLAAVETLGVGWGIVERPWAITYWTFRIHSNSATRTLWKSPTCFTEVFLADPHRARRRNRAISDSFDAYMNRNPIIFWDSLNSPSTQTERIHQKIQGENGKKITEKGKGAKNKKLTDLKEERMEWPK